ncbi:ATP-binding protein [Actinospica robiniae]|uniref:ATP-binding protein n=1 Tax=Actinospica robiniae TaxID=304901 RepID=UPI000422AB18|nr:ATP-binding protein [Actinospica robiniae]
MPNCPTPATNPGEPLPHPAPNPWVTLTVPVAAGDTAVLTHVRALARHTLASWHVDDEQADDILVVLSELATNALVHTSGPAEIRLTNLLAGIQLEVSDTSTREPDQETGPTDGEHGYGLALIAAALADELDCVQQLAGKTVTAHFAKRRSSAEQASTLVAGLARR